MIAIGHRHPEHPTQVAPRGGTALQLTTIVGSPCWTISLDAHAYLTFIEEPDNKSSRPRITVAVKAGDLFHRLPFHRPERVDRIPDRKHRVRADLTR
jgi:hypothetical protein